MAHAWIHVLTHENQVENQLLLQLISNTASDKLKETLAFGYTDSPGFLQTSLFHEIVGTLNITVETFSRIFLVKDKSHLYRCSAIKKSPSASYHIFNRVNEGKP